MTLLTPSPRAQNAVIQNLDKHKFVFQHFIEEQKKTSKFGSLSHLFTN